MTLTNGAASAGSRSNCPRCGYDQSGVISSWSTACPLDGRCAECGLAFSWSELLCGSLHPPRLLIEHCRWRDLPLALVLTVALATLAWAPFASVWLRLRMMHVIRPLRLVLMALLIVVFTPALCLVREVVLGRSSSMTSLEMLQLWLGESYLVHAKTMVGLPHSGSGWPSFGWETNNVLAFSVAAVVTTCTSALAFAALPVARRRAKVHWGHIGRCWAYSVATIPVLIVIALWFLPKRETLRGFRGIEIGVDPWVWLVLIAWFGAFWAASAKRYLKMERSLAVGLSVTAVGAAGALFQLGLPSLIVWLSS